ncbi:MAG: hypothetical protein R3328_01535 [Planococcaceae bacterium]|nr:hypothetical protein [Planococcaceae bacterium]
MNSKLKKVLVSSIALTTILGAGTGIASANSFAKENISSVQQQEKKEMSKDDIKQLKMFFDEYGVEKQIQNSLILKLKKGIPWDSIKPESEIVSSEEIVSETETQVIQKFKDGSISVQTLETPAVQVEDNISTDNNESIFTPLSVTGGTVTTGTGYRTVRGAKVKVETGICNAWFYADFTTLYGAMDRITSVYDSTVVGIGGTTNSDTLNIVRATETLDNKAEAKLNFQFVAFGGAGSSTVWLKLLVGKDTYSSDVNN